MKDRIHMDPASTLKRIPLAPHQNTSEITPTQDLFVLAHMGVPRVEPEDWCFEIGGLVDTPRVFHLDDLKSYPKHSVQSVHECAGNPMTPEIPTRRVGNIVWSGVKLASLLDAVGVKPDAGYLWSFGLDTGEFEGIPVDQYCKDLPLWRVAAGDVLVAYELNGAPLPPEHGYPARLFVPGFYGTNSVKWLQRMELADRRLDGLFTTTFYNDEMSSTAIDSRSRSKPVWEIAPESIIVSPAPDTRLSATRHTIEGWAWAATGIASVEISIDGGDSWRKARVNERSEWSWQRFTFDWCPEQVGPATLSVRAFSTTGECQPANGKRNAVHNVNIVIDSN
ncbi:MAG: molybdopterin-dependent oxidoreductase [Rhodospirillaceae bacterium]|nr:molybdopterin-dependent oxidoreductase [Rhodospirillaceae bacterium]